MTLLTLCEIVFFIGFGVNHFYPNRTLTIVVAVAAIAVGILMLLGGTIGVRIT